MTGKVKARRGHGEGPHFPVETQPNRTPVDESGLERLAVKHLQWQGGAWGLRKVGEGSSLSELQGES